MSVEKPGPVYRLPRELALLAFLQYLQACIFATLAWQWRGVPLLLFMGRASRAAPIRASMTLY